MTVLEGLNVCFLSMFLPALPALKTFDPGNQHEPVAKICFLPTHKPTVTVGASFPVQDAREDRGRGISSESMVSESAGDISPELKQTNSTSGQIYYNS